MGGNWEHKDGTYDYVPVDCIRRGLYFSSKISYGELTDLISVRFDKEELKLEVSMMALNECFEFKVQKSSKERFVVKCCGDNCEWVLRASTYKDTNAFHVTSFKNEHTCSRTQTYPNIRNANKKVIGHIIKDQLTDCGRVYRGKEIVKDINQRFKVNISYKQAWRGKHYAEQLLSGSAEEAFVKLPAYCHNLELANPGTITHILRDEFNSFEMVFIAIGAAVSTMFLAVGMDGNNQILPIAFGVGKTESGDAWTWFLSKLKDGIADHPELAIISDRASSIDLAIRTVYPLAYHGLCCRHLMVNLRLKGKAQESLWWATCKAYTISDFETNYNALCAMRPAIRETLTRVGFHKWARSHCPVQRFNIMTSNSAESINALSRNARKLPITKLIDFFVSLLQKWYFERRQLGGKYYIRTG
ncbi:hypothetical protein E3N88_01537 [Mikania micrantha]|uniref:Transposase MuDR plant domain-containing protein n=1 Tax=Mikania micrantha TaxID=192012 RepID=A0A5N6Q355_9ASTR|nr:hypothetical protein E3N88_01537 [Mikania micrantha]